jgi:hypothetical protein
MFQNFSGSFFSSAVFIGLGVAGLVSKNCNSECQGLDTEAECVSLCFTGVIDSQPDSVRIFIRILMGFWAPFCELMVAYCAWRYPIKGMRLRKINNAIRESLGENLKEDDTPAPSNRGDLMKHMASHRASSKVGMDLEREPEANAAALAQIIEFTATRPGPKSLAVFFECCDEQFSKSPSFYDSQHSADSVSSESCWQVHTDTQILPPRVFNVIPHPSSPSVVSREIKKDVATPTSSADIDVIVNVDTRDRDFSRGHDSSDNV